MKSQYCGKIFIHRKGTIHRRSRSCHKAKIQHWIIFGSPPSKNDDSPGTLHSGTSKRHQGTAHFGISSFPLCSSTSCRIPQHTDNRCASTTNSLFLLLEYTTQSVLSTTFHGIDKFVHVSVCKRHICKNQSDSLCFAASAAPIKRFV